MLVDTLNEAIIDMKTVHELETASADTKKQATADYNFKQLIVSLQQMVNELKLAVDNSEFKPSASVVNGFKSFLFSCNKVVDSGVANTVTTQYITSESKKLYAAIGQEWTDFYTGYIQNMLSLLNTIKDILNDEKKAIYAANKIKKAATWNTDVENYNYLKQGMSEAEELLNELGLKEDSQILEFLRLVSEGKATISNLTDDILKWIIDKKLADKMQIVILEKHVR